MDSFFRKGIRKLVYCVGGRSRMSFVIFTVIVFFPIEVFIQTSFLLSDSNLPSFSNDEIIMATVANVPASEAALVRDEQQEDNSLAHTGVKLATVASRLERMKMYRERYKYEAPLSYNSHVERDEICGTGPNYDTFFARSHKERSRNNEDKIIYELFFKQPAGKSLQHGNSLATTTVATRGHIVEMGAFDGIQESNSRLFDTCLGWDTLLVEANPLNWQKLVNNRPHAHRFNFAPSCSEEDERMNKTVKFDKYPMTNAGMVDGSVTTAYTARNNTVDVPCGSLTKVLLDVFPGGHVSFFSLDVEGAEPHVLEHIDFDKVFIEILMVENRNNFCGNVCESRERFRQTMNDNGYILFPNTVEKSDLFIHPLSHHVETMQKKELLIQINRALASLRVLSNRNP